MAFSLTGCGDIVKGLAAPSGVRAKNVEFSSEGYFLHAPYSVTEPGILQAGSAIRYDDYKVKIPADADQATIEGIKNSCLILEEPIEVAPFETVIAQKTETASNGAFIQIPIHLLPEDNRATCLEDSDTILWTQQFNITHPEN